jgi:hypothetical protein
MLMLGRTVYAASIFNIICLLIIFMPKYPEVGSVIEFDSTIKYIYVRKKLSFNKPSNFLFVDLKNNSCAIILEQKYSDNHLRLKIINNLTINSSEYSYDF